MAGLLRPENLNQLSTEAAMAQMEAERQAKVKKEQEQLELQEAFLSREIHPQAIDRINNAISLAAKQGKQQVEVFTFPSTYCNDGGRRINNSDTDWPSSLEGFPKKAYEFFQKELRPLGFKLNVEILNFPGGMPGDVAFILTW